MSGVVLLIGAFALQTDSEIRQILIRESIARYEGTCPCPYSVSRRGKCGGTSAYSRRGGRAVLCYEHDVTDKMVEEYRESRKKP